MQKVVIVISILLFSLPNQIYSQDSRFEQASYEILNQVFLKKVPNSFLCKKVLQVDWEKYLEIEYLMKNNSGIDKFFEPIQLDLTKQDLDFMKEMVLNKRIKQWKKRNIKNIQLINNCKRIDYSHYSLYRISLPVFNEDLSYSIIIEEYNGGMEDGSSFLRIFKNDGNLWKEIAFIQLWVS